MAETLINILNDYAEMYKDGHKEVLPAMGRIIEKIESEGYTIEVTSKGYILK